MTQRINRTIQEPSKNVVSYSVFGEGNAILFIHAGGLNSDMWLPQVESLKSKFQLITYDIKGHGNSKIGKDLYEIDDVLDILEAEGVEKVSLVGLSLGAVIALDFALEHPERVGKLVLASPGLFGYQDQNEQYLKLMDDIVQAVSGGDRQAIVWALKMATAIGDREAIADERIDEYVERQLNNYLTTGGLHHAPLIKNATPVDRLKDLPHEVLVLYGEEDFAYIRENAEKLFNEIPNAELVSIEGAAHLINLENQTAFNRTVRNFLLKQTS